MAVQKKRAKKHNIIAPPSLRVGVCFLGLCARFGGMSVVQATQDEPVANFECCFAFEAEEPSKHRLQELMWEEMRRYHPGQGPWKGTRSPSTAGQVDSSPR